VAFAGQEIRGPDGFRLRLIRTAAETDGELLQMEATYGGTERQYGPGETFEVQAGVRTTVRGRTAIEDLL
jgi:hypothetical protein